MSTTLLTGATGFLGAYLLRDLMRAGTDVAVLVRPKEDQSAQARVDELLARFRQEGEDFSGPSRVIAADLHAPDLAMGEADREWVRGKCDRILHCAADLRFHASGQEPYLSNVDGTRHVLRLCEATGIHEFHLVSTAYVCGLREGRILEDDLECGQVFANDYERSKFMGEALVREAPFLDRIRIYRPSVVVGDSVTGFSNSDTGLYAILRVAGFFATADVDETLGALSLSTDDAMNLVPVDWVSATITYLLGPGRSGDDPSRTYHVTSPDPVAAGKLFDSVVASEFRPARASRAAFSLAFDTYRSYFRNHPAFDDTNTVRDAPHLPCPRLEGERLRRVINFASASGPISSAGAEPSLALSVVGPEGGDFDLSEPATPKALDMETLEVAQVRATCTTGTLVRLVDGSLGLDDAIYSGLLSVEGNPARFEGSMSLLRAYLTSEEADWIKPTAEGAA